MTIPFDGIDVICVEKKYRNGDEHIFMKIYVPPTAFNDKDDLCFHKAQRLPKITSLTISDVVHFPDMNNLVLRLSALGSGSSQSIDLKLRMKDGNDMEFKNIRREDLLKIQTNFTKQGMTLSDEKELHKSMMQKYVAIVDGDESGQGMKMELIQMQLMIPERRGY
ncbi:MAG: hypothetical protein EZS28_041502 [Streblomastix strix]|uniref:Uncharacterized protein n=1 Tax=Streblomastix strix TaxID=222440 RepID=A0A5J4TZA0_9EUKA|nr:MAG: hypothetical protein EZS28_041502 [Streblomastix strix]